VYCAVVTVIILYVVKALMGLRVTVEELVVDTTAHGGFGCSL
jgi:ammonia channel protein AmtB